jgi:hypothetical protein
MIIQELFGFNKISCCWEKLYVVFPISPHVKMLSCSGGHIGFLIDEKHRGPYMEHSYQGTNSSDMGFRNNSLII